MIEEQKKTISKFLSLILRHNPQTIGLHIDENGWADVQELLMKSAQKNRSFSFADLKEIIATNDKQRFSFNSNETKIRANQGHSINIDLALTTGEPPAFLYHGTVDKFLANIRQQGLLKMSRQHVHLSKDRETAEKVGSRRGKPVILSVRSGHMFRDGFSFFLSENGVWLTDHVPAGYIDFKE